MSIVRTALILSVAIAILPSDRAQQERVYQNVAAAAHWTSTYCDRNPATCENAGVAWAAFVEKAKFAGEVAYAIGVQYVAGQGSLGEQKSEPARFEKATAEKIRGTLTSSDLEPAWRGGKTKTAQVQ
jgi:hypothetical protein